MDIIIHYQNFAKVHLINFLSCRDEKIFIDELMDYNDLPLATFFQDNLSYYVRILSK